MKYPANPWEEDEQYEAKHNVDKNNMCRSQSKRHWYEHHLNGRWQLYIHNTHSCVLTAELLYTAINIMQHTDNQKVKLESTQIVKTSTKAEHHGFGLICEAQMHFWDVNEKP